MLKQFATSWSCEAVSSGQPTLSPTVLPCLQLMALTTDPGYMAYYPTGQEVRAEGSEQGLSPSRRSVTHGQCLAERTRSYKLDLIHSNHLPRSSSARNHSPSPASPGPPARPAEHQRADWGDEQRVHPADCAAGHVLHHHLRCVSGGISLKALGWAGKQIAGGRRAREGRQRGAAQR